MTNIVDNIKSLADIMNTLSNLDNPEYVTEQGITQEELPMIKEELQKQLDQYKDQTQEYIEYKLTVRQEHLILANGINEQIKTLSNRMKIENNQISYIDSWIDYLCKFAWIEKLKTAIAEIKYTWWEKTKVTDFTILPEDLKEHIFTLTVEAKDKEEQESLIEKWYKEDIIYSSLPEIKKWFKWVMSWWDEKILELWNQLNAEVITKEEHEEEMKKIKEEQKQYEWKVRIDDSKSLSIK